MTGFRQKAKRILWEWKRGGFFPFQRENEPDDKMTRIIGSITPGVVLFCLFTILGSSPEGTQPKDPKYYER